MINLPHQEPIRFVKELLSKDENFLTATCIFPYIPTLAMVCEASAQATAGFDTDSKQAKIGFLVSLKEIEKLKEFDKKEYLVKIEKSFAFGQMQEYKFELKSDTDVYAKGFITISIQN
ncbi:hypothetical protein [Halarcobacter ebronensis]|uniref:Uncharacterized protein n=1 Tax=Halarcobacter ebronensis TaxID=1462615 RepID=A0A4Q1B004_9BACT|nr:hypothetical protein [Halarcobacter ebronensis]QKF83499.1 hypothetical protein AEBR_3053 [Halarcobacter ebronensis]RXK08293.1 hypothetical protein CRV07_00365 [Halarcobacter ebronensis]